MSGEDVGDRGAIGDYIALKLPVAAQMLFEQRGVSTCGLAIDGVVSTHHRLRFPLHDRRSKRGKIGIFHIVTRGFHIDAVPRRFRTAVHGEMLGRGNSLQISRIIPLQTRDECHPHA